MSPDRAAGAERRRRALRHRSALRWVLGTLALLLFCWPFVSTPRPALPAAFAHVFGSWALAIAALWWISRGVGREPGGDGDG